MGLRKKLFGCPAIYIQGLSKLCTLEDTIYARFILSPSEARLASTIQSNFNFEAPCIYWTWAV